MANFISLSEKLSRIYFKKFDKNSEELNAYYQLCDALGEALDKSGFKRPNVDFCAKIYGTDYSHMRKKLAYINEKRNVVSKATLNKYYEELNASQYVLKKYMEDFLTNLTQLQDFLLTTPITNPAEKYKKMWEMHDKKYPLEKRYEISVRDENGDVVYENGKPKVRLETEEEVDKRINRTLDERKVVLEEKDYNHSFTMKGLPEFDVEVTYNRGEGRIEIMYQYLGTYQGYEVWLCPWDAASGYLTWSPEVGLVGVEERANPLTISFVENGAWLDYNADSFLFYAFSGTPGSGTAAASVLQVPNPVLTKQ